MLEIQHRALCILNPLSSSPSAQFHVFFSFLDCHITYLYTLIRNNVALQFTYTLCNDQIQVISVSSILNFCQFFMISILEVLSRTSGLVLSRFIWKQIWWMVWRPEINSQDPCGRRRESTPTSVFCPMHTCAYMINKPTYKLLISEKKLSFSSFKIIIMHYCQLQVLLALK